MMRVADGDGERVGFVFADLAGGGQQRADHHADLLLRGVARADHRFLDEVSRVFMHLKPGAGDGDDGSASRRAELERGRGVVVHKSFLDCGGDRLMAAQDGGEALIEFG
jgi:hypothetical protein